MHQPLQFSQQLIGKKRLGTKDWSKRFNISVFTMNAVDITYDQVKELIGHEFRKYLIEMEYGITAKPSTSGNTVSNVVLERFH